jgi:voltage-dependent calcium channel N type alpha-1B
MTYQAKPNVKTNYTGHKCRDFMIRIALHPAFDQFIMTMILLNTFVLGIKWYDMPANVLLVTKILNYFFSVVFTIEAIIKLIAMRANYFKDAWNQFDFIVVIGTWLVIVVLTAYPKLEILGTILRTLRIGRVFRIVKRAPSIQIIF